MSPNASGVGLQTNSMRFENLSSGTFRRIAEEFLMATRMRRWDRSALLSIGYYFSDVMAVVQSRQDRVPRRSAPRTPLPEGADIDAGLTETVLRRRSGRDFSGAPVGLDEITSVLRFAGSVTAEADIELADGAPLTMGFRTVPSAGGLYPVEIWLAAQNVAGLEPGLHRFLPVEESLAAQAGPAAVTELIASFDPQDGSIDFDRAAAVLLLVGNPWRSMRKYGPRGMRSMFHEAGGIAQNAHLAATGLGLESVDFSGFYDDEAHSALGLDGVHRTLLHTVLLGAA
ncbi:SagB/ThcOx family dehydrogenase [Streptomyces kanamyceticus]|uniref:SagB/ThcOx family dehydrogenase n=2 Tax=Streptomyces kanamyceticus TaxID=1967 RepID=A0A5J6GC68_STRKN|nr:SagB/ThcOx family dehydrogenase [Streptomyces kanamyceticus]